MQIYSARSRGRLTAATVARCQRSAFRCFSTSRGTTPLGIILYIILYAYSVHTRRAQRTHVAAAGNDRGGWDGMSEEREREWWKKKKNANLDRRGSKNTGKRVKRLVRKSIFKYYVSTTADTERVARARAAYRKPTAATRNTTTTTKTRAIGECCGRQFLYGRENQKKMFKILMFARVKYIIYVVRRRVFTVV